METFSELLAICAGNSPIAGYSITDGIQKFWWQINISQFFGLLSVYVYFTQRVSANNFVYNSAFKKMYKNVVCQLSDILFRLHMTSSNGTIFCVNGPVWRQLTGHWSIPLKKGQWRGALILMFSLIYARTNGWARIRLAGDLSHRAHHNGTVMSVLSFKTNLEETPVTFKIWFQWFAW